MKEIKSRTILLALAVTTCMLMNIVLFMQKVINPKIEIERKQEQVIFKEQEQEIQEQEIQEVVLKHSLEDVSGLSEHDRIREYLGQYLSYLQVKDYAKAYSFLYDDFKQNYFPTLSDFKNYVSELYPTDITINHDDIQRQGKYFILFVTVFPETMEEENMAQKFIIQESDYGEFVLSFEVI